MKAVILGAGFGKRLGNLTRYVPKPLLKIRNKTILELQILHLKKNGIKKVFINTHYLSNQFKKKIQKSKNIMGINITFKYQKILNGTAGGVKIFEKELIKDKKFFVIYGDILFKENLKDLVKFHDRKNSFISIYVHTRKQSNSIVTYSRKDGVVKAFNERPSNISEKIILKDSKLNDFGVNSAIYLINSSILSHIPEKGNIDFPNHVFPEFISAKKMYALKIRRKRIAVDSIRQYNQARREFT